MHSTENAKVEWDIYLVTLKLNGWLSSLLKILFYILQSTKTI